MLIDTIKADLLTARRERNSTSVSVLSTLIGELTNSSKMVDGVKVIADDLVVKTVKKFIKNMEETLAISPDSEYLRTEIEILEPYLPKSLSQSELETVISGLIREGSNNIGLIMAGLKSRYPNQYDGKEASQIATKFLKGN